jgi:hypothetical protein
MCSTLCVESNFEVEHDQCGPCSLSQKAIKRSVRSLEQLFMFLGFMGTVSIRHVIQADFILYISPTFVTLRTLINQLTNHCDYPTFLLTNEFLKAWTT